MVHVYVLYFNQHMATPQVKNVHSSRLTTAVTMWDNLQPFPLSEVPR